MNARRFLRGLLIGTFLGVAGVTVPGILIDPTAYLGTVWPSKPQLCSHGISADARRAKLLVASAVRPREILLGTSRVAYGFAYTDAAALLTGPQMNLAFSGATLAEIDAAFFHALAAGNLKRVWIGVDFGLFVPGPPPQPPSVVGNRWSRLSAALWGGDSIRSTYEVLTDSRLCRHPRYDPLGFPIDARRLIETKAFGWPQAVKRSRKGMHKKFSELADIVLSQPGDQATESWNILRRLVLVAQHEQVSVVFFAGPAHRYYRDALTAAGLDEALGEWRQDMAAFSRKAGVPYFDWSDYAPTLQSDLEHCEPAADNDCPMYDVNHFRPHVGRVMLEEMLSALESKSAP